MGRSRVSGWGFMGEMRCLDPGVCEKEREEGQVKSWEKFFRLQCSVFREEPKRKADRRRMTQNRETEISQKNCLEIKR